MKNYFASVVFAAITVVSLVHVPATARAQYSSYTSYDPNMYLNRALTLRHGKKTKHKAHSSKPSHAKPKPRSANRSRASSQKR